jgi:hypothetical protein
MSINSREATFEGEKLVLELKAMPIPTPKINIPAKMAMVVTLNTEDWNPEGLEELVDLLGVLRLMVACWCLRLEQQSFCTVIFIMPIGELNCLAVSIMAQLDYDLHTSDWTRGQGAGSRGQGARSEGV